MNDEPANFLNAFDSVVDAIKRCNASLFTDRAISYRMDNGFDHFEVFLSTGVMKMVRSDIASSGVMFSIDTETGFSDVTFITGAWGLGENVVQGLVDPDEYFVHKTTFKQGYRQVLRRRLGKKQMKMILSKARSQAPVRNIPTAPEEQSVFCLSDEQVLELADFSIKIENHYSNLAGHTVPMDMEWAVDGIDGLMYIVQARPETVASHNSVTKLEQYLLETPIPSDKIVAKGRAVGTKIGTGIVRIIRNTNDLENFQDKDILVAESTSPDWEPVMKRASAIITNSGGRTCHASIIARELGIPAVVGAENATNILKSGEVVTISCAQGEEGVVAVGTFPFKILSTDITTLKKPKTEMMINLGNPERAFALSFLPCDGVGLCRMEFVVSEYLKVHPMALLYTQKVTSSEERRAIYQLTKNCKSGAEFMVRTISEGIATVGAAFYPRPVVVRLSDFKSNEYASLIGGKYFEPEEENPMIGFRGASRYTHPAYLEGFALECEAMRRVIFDYGLTNLILMIPFCRRVDEAKKVIEVLEKNGLPRGPGSPVKVYMMCEIPSNVIMIDEFSKYFDGFSIGSNDLTQLTLGCDRDSALVANLFDERDEAVQKMLQWAVEGARRNNRHSGICGQAPSDYPEIAEMLVKAGIDSISLTPDSLLKTMIAVQKVEEKLQRN